MAKTQSEAIQIYYQLLAQGVDPNTAYAKAVEGMPTQADLQKQAADKQQQNGLAQVGGTLAGVIGTKYLYNQAFGEAGKEITKDALAKTAAENATWNAGADAATTGSAAGTEAASLGYMPYLGALGAGVGGYQLYNAIQNDDTKGAALGGAALGGGLAAAAPLAGFTPVGLPIIAGAALVGALSGGGLNKLLGHKSTKEYQKDRWGALANSQDAALSNYGKQYQNYLGSDQAKIDAQYPNTFEGKKEAGTLRPEDVWGGVDLVNTLGSDYFNKYSEAQRRQLGQALIDNNLIYTDKGDQYINDKTKLMQLKDQVLGNSYKSPLASAITNSMIQKLPLSINTNANAATRIFPEGSTVQAASNAIPLTKLASVIARSKTQSPGINLNGKRVVY